VSVRKVIIRDPVIGSASAEPGGHFTFEGDGIAGEIAIQLRASAPFIPVALPERKGRRLERVR
jgi:hypothetical protein